MFAIHAPLAGPVAASPPSCSPVVEPAAGKALEKFVPVTNKISSFYFNCPLL